MAGIKISDLSVGDWVKIQGVIREIDYLYGKNNVCDTPIEFVEPIPITPEILEKNGFAFLPDDNPRHLRFVDGNIFISTYEGRETFALYCYNDMGWAETFSQTLRYIHQLQHALRLVGVEKEIEV